MPSDAARREDIRRFIVAYRAEINLLKKLKLEIAVNEEVVDATVKAIIK